MPAGADALRRVVSGLRQQGVPPSARVIVVHVSSNSPFRRWPRPQLSRPPSPTWPVRWTDSPDRRHRGPLRRRTLSSGSLKTRGADRCAAAERVLRCGRVLSPNCRAARRRGRALHRRRQRSAAHRVTTAVPIVALLGPLSSGRPRCARPRASSELIEVDGLPCRPCDQRGLRPGRLPLPHAIDPRLVIAAAECLLASRKAKRRRRPARAKAPRRFAPASGYRRGPPVDYDWWAQKNDHAHLFGTRGH